MSRLVTPLNDSTKIPALMAQPKEIVMFMETFEFKDKALYQKLIVGGWHVFAKRKNLRWRTGEESKTLKQRQRGCSYRMKI